METIIEAEVRKEKGTRMVKKLREKGYLPAILYGKEQESIPLSLKNKDFRMILQHLSGKSSGLLELKIKKDNKIIKKSVVLKETQRNLIKDEILHLDFHEVALDKPITAKVPVTLIGESPGVKEGGVLDQMLWEMEVEALPAHIPEKIEVDISSLKIGDILYVSNLGKENVKILNEPTNVVVSVLAPRKEEEEVAPEGEEAEPEVISEEEAEERRKKKEEEKPAEKDKESEEPEKDKKAEKKEKKK
ncbi:MAG: 50S ribosomal protein L25 [bacterium (Candidatus Ratteibacteria) CG_4_10_14_3_um_filter_41_18]|uniref:Large ribosomal subunit protein bL25 n=3 Tax=Candidatus Ratteibacteria TaxID=2979319 RepID=A0A2M7YHN0_9BACT|nr:MAG: 50S ribosomal protein L25 [bacterium (Candidatus Ratteibacteria) CG15_BIG_FIL_POST_REV_8_21_14_020_41_12]PIX76981.1 MAG: 50S ribosomal protein L25 [bacterium (Candidatus Ratteibacteria) CG_4_10_14_3_um_filter_41_18]PJA62479.1 MAG: 50S ribosomal protein L25 [bacterium (Candidatus Ratteibacteria) CG_4_9_14_3_um_filter_41_21]